MKFNIMQITSGGRGNDRCIGTVEADTAEEAVRKVDEEFGGSEVYEANRVHPRSRMDGYSYVEPTGE